MLTLKTNDHPALTQVAEVVQEGENLSLLLHTMWIVKHKNNGIGLAAPQLGESKRVIIIDVNGLMLSIANPVITKRYGGKSTGREGCLSFPGVRSLMVRDKQIIVEGFDATTWEPIKRKLKGLAAICVQHEVDHLDGVTIMGKCDD